MFVAIQTSASAAITVAAACQAGAAASAEYSCQYGSSLTTSPEGEVCYTSSRGNAAAISPSGLITFSGTRHGVTAACGYLSLYTGVGVWALALAGRVVKYRSTMPTWAWWETLAEAAQRGDRAALKEQARQAAVAAWREASPDFPEGKWFECRQLAEEGATLPPAILARRLELAGRAVKEWYQGRYLPWLARKPA